MPIFCQKDVYPHKNVRSHVYFIQIFHEKPYAVMPKFGQKNVKSVITILSYWQKNHKDALFFRF